VITSPKTNHNAVNDNITGSRRIRNLVWETILWSQSVGCDRNHIALLILNFFEVGLR
jgi:hypothetical protein